MTRHVRRSPTERPASSSLSPLTPSPLAGEGRGEGERGWEGTGVRERQARPRSAVPPPAASCPCKWQARGEKVGLAPWEAA